MPMRKRRRMAVFKGVMMAHAPVVTDATTSGGWIGWMRLKIRLIPQLGGEGLKGLPCVVLPPVEATIYEGLCATPQCSKQRRYQEGRGDDRDSELPTRDQDENPLRHDDSTEVDCYQRDGKRAVDEGTVDDHIYIEQVRA